LRERSVCPIHERLSKGPISPEGTAKIAAAHTTHGRETRAIRTERSQELTHLAALEDLARVLQMISGPKTRGRKPNPPEALTEEHPSILWNDACKIDERNIMVPERD
jgi:hypothetical protein